MTEASVIHFNDFDFVYNAYFDNFIQRLLINLYIFYVFFFQAEDGIRDQPRSRGLGDVYKRQT